MVTEQAAAALDLLPCPFCGRRMTRGTDRFYQHAFQRRGALCVAETIRIFECDELRITDWNRRAPITQAAGDAGAPAEAVEAVEAARRIVANEGRNLALVVTPGEIVDMARALLASRPETDEAIEECARVAEADCTPAYGPHRRDMEFLAETQRRNIAERIRSLKGNG